MLRTLNLSRLLTFEIKESGRRLRRLCRSPTFGRRIQVEGKGELFPGSRRSLREARPLEPLLKVEVGSLLSLPLRVFNTLQLDTR